jgi:branched-chain amino acid aminotransferase
MGSFINHDGRIQGLEEARVPATDHGFLFGDSIYETLRTYGRVPFLLDQHLERADNSARGLALEIPWDHAKMTGEVLRTLEAAGNEDSLVRIVVTRGVGPMDMLPRETGPPAVFIYVVPHPVYPEEYFTRGAPVVLVDARRKGTGGVDPTLKTGSRLSNVLALMEARNRGGFEALLSNTAGHVTEGTSSNLFVVTGGRLVTAEVEAGLLPGITRNVVIELAAGLGIDLEERSLLPEEVRGAEEAFLTSTTKMVMPIRRVDEDDIPGPGPVTGRLMEAFLKLVEEECARWRAG